MSNAKNIITNWSTMIQSVYNHWWKDKTESKANNKQESKVKRLQEFIKCKFKKT